MERQTRKLEVLVPTFRVCGFKSRLRHQNSESGHLAAFLLPVVNLDSLFVTGCNRGSCLLSVANGHQTIVACGNPLLEPSFVAIPNALWALRQKVSVAKAWQDAELLMRHGHQS